MQQIFPPPAGFDLRMAHETCALIENAYEQFAQGATWQIAPGYNLLAVLNAKPDGWFARDERFGFVARSQASAAVFVVFRGTESLDDWMSNLSFPQISHPWGKSEEGFSKLYEQCKPDITKAVAAARPAQLFVTGHSLGGALASLATADLTIGGYAPALYTFASPRAGDIDFATRFNASVATNWRVVNTEDIVTTVPLAAVELEAGRKSALFGLLGLAERLESKLTFSHVGVPIAFTNNTGTILGNHEMATYAAALP